MLSRTTFGFAPHGDARWSLRFLELLSVGLIPVIISDGLRLPFDQVIDWSSIVVTIPEKNLLTTNSSATLAPLLAMSVNEARRRSVLAYMVFKTFFRTPQQKVDAFYAAVGSTMYHETVNMKHLEPQVPSGVCIMTGKPKLPANPDRKISLNIYNSHERRHQKIMAVKKQQASERIRQKRDEMNQNTGSSTSTLSAPL